MASTSTIKPLPVYPSAPTGDDLTLLREAKAKLDTDVLIQPVEAVPGSPGRVIALRQKPNFICDYAFIPEPKPDSMLAALDWALSDKFDSRATTVVQQLQDIFGKGVEEIVE